MAALRINNQHAICPLGTIECGSVFKHFHTVDVLGVKEVEHIIHKAVVDGGTIVLHIPNHTVDNHERLGVGVEGVDAVDEHHGTLGIQAATADGAHIGVEHVLDFGFHRLGTCQVELGRAGVHDGSPIGVLLTDEAAIKDGVLIFCTLDGKLCGVIAVGGDIEGRDKGGHFDGIRTFGVGHRGVLAVGQSLYTHA